MGSSAAGTSAPPPHAALLCSTRGNVSASLPGALWAEAGGQGCLPDILPWVLLVLTPEMTQK